MKFFIALVLSLAVLGFANAQSNPGGYSPITFDANNTQLVAILNYGLDQAIPQAIAAGQISEGVWALKDVVSVQNQVVAGMNFDFIVDIGDTTGDTARLNFVVFVAPGGKTVILSSWAIFMLQ